jgi:hypothetical protein
MDERKVSNEEIITEDETIVPELPKSTKFVVPEMPGTKNKNLEIKHYC